MRMLRRVSAVERRTKAGLTRSMGAATFGYDLSVISYVLEAPDFKSTINTDDANYIGFITSSLLLGAFVGSIPASYVADIFSRRTASEWNIFLPAPLAEC